MNIYLITASISNVNGRHRNCLEKEKENWRNEIKQKMLIKITIKSFRVMIYLLIVIWKKQIVERERKKKKWKTCAFKWIYAKLARQIESLIQCDHPFLISLWLSVQFQCIVCDGFCVCVCDEGEIYWVFAHWICIKIVNYCSCNSSNNDGVQGKRSRFSCVIST